MGRLIINKKEEKVNNSIMIVEYFSLGVVIFISVLAALWVWTYGSMVYVKDILNKFKIKGNEKREEK